MTGTFTFVQLMNIVDGRLFTNMDDIYDVLNHATGEDLMTHHLGTAMQYFQQTRPQWFVELDNRLIEAKQRFGNDWMALNKVFTTLKEYSEPITIPTLPENEKEAFVHFMLTNSLLIKKAKDDPDSVTIVNVQTD